MPLQYSKLIDDRPGVQGQEIVVGLSYLGGQLPSWWTRR